MSGQQARLSLGGHHDVLGFIDLPGGRDVEVPAGSLVLGKQKTLGSTMVILPVFAVTPGQISEEQSGI